MTLLTRFKIDHKHMHKHRGDTKQMRPTKDKYFPFQIVNLLKILSTIGQKKKTFGQPQNRGSPK